MIDRDQVIDGIHKTGFGLEYQVSDVLRGSGWNVINNRYYIDDLQNTVREIDLVAYKVTKYKHLGVYTTLIVSCKKSEEKAWAFLSKNIIPNDPNSDWRPLHVWTNDRALNFMMSQPGWRERYFSKLEALGAKAVVRIPETHIFAFQEMNTSKWTPQNDKPIFNSVTSLMKAQAYELDALSERKKDVTVYQFNLVSVADCVLLRVHFDGDQRTVQELDQDLYVANYIIKKRQTAARIHFMRPECFAKALGDYDQLHTANCTCFRDSIDSFYRDALIDYERVALFSEDFEKDVLWWLSWRISEKFKKSQAVKSLRLTWDEKQDKACVMLDLDEELVNYLDTDSKARMTVKGALLKYYRYKGDFQFVVDDIPF